MSKYTLPVAEIRRKMCRPAESSAVSGAAAQRRVSMPPVPASSRPAADPTGRSSTRQKTLPAANAPEFLEAMRHFDHSGAPADAFDADGQTSLLLVLRSE